MSEGTPLDPGSLVTPVVQVPGNEPTETPNPVEPDPIATAPNVLVSPEPLETPAVTGFSTLADPVPPPQSIASPIPIVDPAYVGTVEPLGGPLATPMTPAPVVHPATQVQPLGVTPGISDPNITLSQIEPGIKWAIANGLLTVDDLAKAVGDHVRELFREYV